MDPSKNPISEEQMSQIAQEVGKDAMKEIKENMTVLAEKLNQGIPF